MGGWPGEKAGCDNSGGVALLLGLVFHPSPHCDLCGDPSHPGDFSTPAPEAFPVFDTVSTSDLHVKTPHI